MGNFTQSALTQPQEQLVPEIVVASQTGRPAPRRWLRWGAWLTLGLGLGMALLFVGRTWLRPHEFHGFPIQSPELAADFTLESSTGQPLRLSDLRGKYVLLFFGYTACPDVCPLTLADWPRPGRCLARSKMTCKWC